MRWVLEYYVVKALLGEQGKSYLSGQSIKLIRVRVETRIKREKRMKRVRKRK